MGGAPVYSIPQVLLGLEESAVRRKGEQRGYVRKIGKAWHVEYSDWVQTDAGIEYKPVSRKVGPATGAGALTKRGAQKEAYDRFVSKANGPAAIPQGVCTVQQFVDGRFWPQHVELLKKGGKDHYRTILHRHVLPFLGSMQLRDVKRPAIQGLVTAKVAQGLSSQTVHHIVCAVSAILKHARLLGFYEGNPIEGLKAPEVRNAERRALTWDQVQSLAAESGRFGPLVLLLAATGLRIGEACGLRWKNVRLEPPASIVVAESFTRAEFTTPKGGKIRVVPLTPEARAVLAMIPRRGDDDLVFASQAGTALDGPNILNRHIKPAAKRAGLGKVTFHDLRHTANTLAEKAGIGDAARQKFMGHADARTNARYTHPEAEDFVRRFAEVQKGTVQ